MKSRGFPPVARADAKVLILGSLPGTASIAAGQYYAHPQNAFWKILGSLFGFEAQSDYEHRCRCLMENHIAVWDVCAAAMRDGSLDADIEKPEINDFAAFFEAHSKITAVYFNGTTAEKLFRKHVAYETVTFTRKLPSTSPAHAGMSFEKKLEAWQAVCQPP